MCLSLVGRLSKLLCDLRLVIEGHGWKTFPIEALTFDSVLTCFLIGGGLSTIEIHFSWLILRQVACYSVLKIELER